MAKKKTKNKTDEILIPDEVHLQVGKEEVTLTEMPRKKYKKLTSILGKIIFDIDQEKLSLDFAKRKDFMGIAEYLGDKVLLDIEALATGLEPNFIDENITMRQEMNLLKNIWELNHVDEVVENLLAMVGGIKPLLEKLKRKNQR